MMETCTAVSLPSLYLPVAVSTARTTPPGANTGGAADSAQYSALRQIDRSNVNRLEVAWTYPIGDGRKYLFNPIVVDGLMYVLARNNAIVALDAATGKEAWVYAPEPAPSIITNRGITYWESKDRSDRRLLFSAKCLAWPKDMVMEWPIRSWGERFPATHLRLARFFQ
jgi:quinoprotein glucose dehydrogenase